VGASREKKGGPLPLSERANRRFDIPWVRDELIDYGDVEVELCIPPELYERETVGNHFIAGKNRAMVEAELAAVGDRPVERIVDVGVYKGGSAVLYHKLFAPKKLVAIELNTKPLRRLDEYVARQADRSLVVAYGVNQADGAALDRICASEFGAEPIDLVIDDASHLCAETRATFRALFPRLRPGGLYIIEDWSWAHWPGDYWQTQRGGAYFRDKEPLTNLLIELILLCGSSPQLVSSVRVETVLFYVERGPGVLEPGFELSDHYFSRGERAPRFGPNAADEQVIYSSPTFKLR